ncbi:hypothetical protein [Egicoccus sp. AB-alg2]|uniref:hypothetical protein n=1 Tax=Egicoccus sp. AB-alg2 TaxID=3242693 RepID=UPI00359EA2F9
MPVPDAPTPGSPQEPPPDAARPGEPPDPGAHDRGRLRAGRRLVVVGGVLGVLGAAALGLLGAPGGSGLVAVLLGLVVGCVLAAIHLAVFSLVDEARRRPVSLRRPLWALGLFVTAGLLLVLVGGASRSL